MERLSDFGEEEEEEEKENGKRGEWLRICEENGR